MNNKIEIQNNVRAALDSLDGITSATAGPFFYTRVQARLYNSEKNIWEKLSGFIARPTIAIAMVTLVIIMNTVAVLQHKNTSTLASDQSEQSIYEEFNVAVNNFYDYEIKEP